MSGKIPVNHDDREARCLILGNQGIVSPGDQSVNAPPLKLAQIAALAVTSSHTVAEQSAVAMFGQMVFEGGCQLSKKWVCDSWDDDANDVCLTPQQCPSDLIRPVVQFLDCVRNLVFGLLAEVAAIVEDP